MAAARPAVPTAPTDGVTVDLDDLQVVDEPTSPGDDEDAFGELKNHFLKN